MATKTVEKRIIIVQGKRLVVDEQGKDALTKRGEQVADAAAKVYRSYSENGYEVHLISTGGKSTGYATAPLKWFVKNIPENSEAAVIKERIVSQWPEHKGQIYLEDASTNREENLLFSKNIIKESKLMGPSEHANITIVVDRYHVESIEPIAKALFRPHNIEFVPVETDIPSWQKPFERIKELGMRLYYKRKYPDK